MCYAAHHGGCVMLSNFTNLCVFYWRKSIPIVGLEIEWFKHMRDNQPCERDSDLLLLSTIFYIVSYCFTLSPTPES